MMKPELDRIKAFSAKFAPPKIDLREAEINDSYGDESYATIPIDHKKPEDVKLEELNHYGSVWPFMEFTDKLFYLYSVFKAYSEDPEVWFIDSFLYSLDIALTKGQKKLIKEEIEELSFALNYAYNAWPIYHADWAQCPVLQNFLNVIITDKDMDELYLTILKKGNQKLIE